MGYDFEGWATKNDMRCSDGLTIRKDAFRVNDGMRVPLVWNHQHNSVGDVLGHADLENRENGVWARCSFNDSPEGKGAKERVIHGDVKSLSIWANNLEKIGNDVLHGVIREVSLVLAGANPGAFIESVLSHGEPMDEDDDEGIIHTGEGIFISHADPVEPKKEEPKVEEPKGDKTVREVLDGMTDEQKAAVGIIVEQAVKDAKNEEDDNSSGKKEDEEMKHNMFEGEAASGTYLSHADQEQILKDAVDMGSLRKAIEYHMENPNGILAHSIPTDGMTVATGTQNYGFNDPSMLFPDYKALNDKPEFISRNMDWVAKVMDKVHHTPFSRIKSLYANITESEARAKGYVKGNQKTDEVFSLLKRTTSSVAL